MKNPFSTHLHQLKKIANQFDEKANHLKLEYLKGLEKLKLPDVKLLVEYQEVLIFICAYPSDTTIKKLAEKELLRIARFMQEKKNKYQEKFENSGLPYSSTVGVFSHDLLSWMIQHTKNKVEYYYFGDPQTKLNEVLRVTLPSVEREHTSAGLENEDLLAALKVEKRNWLQFILNEVSRLNQTPWIKDQYYDSLQLAVKINPASNFLSLPFNRIKENSVFFHSELLKNFDQRELLNRNVQSPIELNKQEKENLIEVIRNSLTLMVRETDTSTHMDLNSLRLYKMDRGISIALYTLLPQRQLPFESYVGYTLFKNGFPAAYGGAWLFGKRALFGINIFESFRGGESGYILCELLRLYRQVFEVDYFEVEPYQYGENNPDGIKSGAFWFYYRYGFRPLDEKLLRLAESEKKKMKRDKKYRTNKETLIKFTKSNIAVNLANHIPVKAGQYISKITAMIAKEYKSNRVLAVAECVKKLKSNFGESFTPINIHQQQMMEEFALLAAVVKPNSPEINELYKKLIQSKVDDVYEYQKKLKELLKFLG